MRYNANIFNFDFSRLDGELLAIGMIIAVLLFVLAAAICVLTYVFQGIGLFTIARRRKISNYGLAWVPVGNMWIMGSIADNFSVKTSGWDKKLRHWILWLFIGAYVFCGIGYVFILFTGFYTEMHYIYSAGLIGLIIGGIAMLLIGAGALVAALVLEYISLYRVYKSCKPENAVIFIILSILFNITIPFFLFAMRNSDEGIPKTVQREQVPYIADVYYTVAGDGQNGNEN